MILFASRYFVPAVDKLDCATHRRIEEDGLFAA